MERRRRSFVKSISWRLIAFLTTVVVAFIYLGKFEEALIIGIGANVIKVGLYYMHERAWLRTKWGMA